MPVLFVLCFAKAITRITTIVTLLQVCPSQYARFNSCYFLPWPLLLLPVVTAAADVDADGAATSSEDAALATPAKTPQAKKSASKRSKSSGSDDKPLRSGSPSSLFGWLSSEAHPLPAPVAALGLFFMLGLMMLYTIHCVGVSADMYSAPSIVLQSHRQDGSFYVFDDFREAYAWLRHNTHPETKVASW